MAFDISMIKATYERLASRVEAARKATAKPLTASEKILYAHLWDGEAKQPFVRGMDYVDFAPDRIADLLTSNFLKALMKTLVDMQDIEQ